jgi:hypothetical protein
VKEKDFKGMPKTLMPPTWVQKLNEAKILKATQKKLTHNYYWLSKNKWVLKFSFCLYILYTLH